MEAEETAQVRAGVQAVREVAGRAAGTADPTVQRPELQTLAEAVEDLDIRREPVRLAALA